MAEPMAWRLSSGQGVADGSTVTEESAVTGGSTVTDGYPHPMEQDPRPVPTLSPPLAPSSDDWPARAADLVETVVGLLRDKTIRPLTLVARALVFGIVVLTALTVTAVFVSISLVRLLTVYAFSGRVWASDLLIGAIFVVIGLVTWTQRTDRKTRTRSAR